MKSLFILLLGFLCIRYGSAEEVEMVIPEKTKGVLVNIINDITGYGQQVPEDFKGEDGIEQRSKSYWEKLDDALRAANLGVLMRSIPGDPDVSALPLSGLSDEELFARAEKGNGDACLVMALRRSFNHVSWWNWIPGVDRWLRKAKECGRAGAEFAHQVFLCGTDEAVCAEDLPGYGEFVETVGQGDFLPLMLVCSFDPGERIAERLDQLIEEAHGRLSSADAGYRLRFAKACLALYGSLPVRYDQRMMEWCAQAGDKEDLEAMACWLRVFPYFMRPSSPEDYQTSRSDVKRIVRYYTELVRRGYIFQAGVNPAYEPGRRIDCVQFVQLLYGDTDWHQLDLDWQRLAVKRGEVDALYHEMNLSLMSDDYDKIYPLVERLRKIGYSCERYVHLGLDGIGFEWNREERAYCYRMIRMQKRFADEGDVDACLLLADVYRSNLLGGPDPDEEYRYRQKAIDILESLVKERLPRVKDELARLYMDQVRLVMKKKIPRQQEEKLLGKMLGMYDHVKKEALVELKNICFLIGYMYEEGFGTEVDCRKAARYYREGADLGCAKSMNNLGILYEQGRGVEKDLSKARELYERAVESGYKDAGQNIKRVPE